MMEDLTMTQRFKQARAATGESAEQVASELNNSCSKQYLYDVLRFPEKNPDIFLEACDYIEEAGINVPASERNLATAKK